MARGVSQNEMGSPLDPLDSITPAPKDASGLEDVWVETRSDNRGPGRTTRRPVPPDVFNGISTAIPGLGPLDSGARAAALAEQKITFLEGCRRYPKAMA